MRAGRVLILVLLPWLAAPVHAQGVGRSDDAYHYALFADGQYDANYVEWWYFNLFDQAKGLQLALTYSILDPDNISGFGMAAVSAIVFTPNGQFTEIGSRPASAFHASTAQADVLIAGSSDAVGFVQVLSDDAYRVVGSINAGHQISWNLLYVRQGASWKGVDRERVGLFPWENMSWLQYMPGASVSGVVVVDGQRYTLANTRGYHDHNWGEWIPFTVTWNWAQYFEQGLDFSIGDFRNSPAGTVSVSVQGQRTAFTKDEYTLSHSDWTYDAVHGLFFPMTTWLYAQRDDTVLMVRIRAHRTLPVVPPPQLPLPLVPVIYEQTATFTGWIWRRDAAGGWSAVRSFAGPGFKEYTGVTVARP